MNNTTGAVLLSCSITSAANFCQNTGTASVPAGNYLQVRARVLNGAPTNRNFRVTFRY